MKTENVDPQTVVSPNAALIENEEDFFVLGNDNLEGSGNCPLVLKIAACQLLLEITAFLRETYRILPRQKYGTLRGHGRNTIGGDKRLSNRRWSSVASTSGGTSHQSIQSFVDHGQVHVFQTGKLRMASRNSVVLNGFFLAYNEPKFKKVVFFLDATYYGK